MANHVVDSLETIPRLSDTAVTVGSYDGVHLGHRAMIRRLHEAGHRRGLTSLVITFHPHHRVYFGRERQPFLLTDRGEKVELLEKTGVDAVLVLPFSRPLAGMTAAQFLRDILSQRLGCRLLLIGHDQAIGHDQRCGADAIGEIAHPVGVEIASVGPVMDATGTISSTRIRTLLREGDVAGASRLLGYHYFLTGQVVHGEARGRHLGYPTANISLGEPLKLVPADGIYAVAADISGGTEKGMLYVGRRPTFGDGPQAVELFLLDFSGDLYGKEVRVHLLDRLRGDVAFASTDELTRQIRVDEARARELFRAKRHTTETLDKASRSP